jgi:flagellar export protein FliJ
MAAFHFRLASVMRFREHIQQEKQWELNLLNQAHLALEEEIYGLEQELLRAEASTVAEEGTICFALDLRLRGDYARVLSRRIAEKRDSLASLGQKLVEKRDELVEAMRAVKILEQLRTRLEEKFRHQLEIADQKFGDEIGLRKFSGPDTGQNLP